MLTRSCLCLCLLALVGGLGGARLASGQDEVGNWAACGGISVAFCGEDRACADCANDGWVCKSGGEGAPDAYYWQCVPDPDESSSDSASEPEEGEEEEVAPIGPTTNDPAAEGAEEVAPTTELDEDAEDDASAVEPAALPDPASIAASVTEPEDAGATATEEDPAAAAAVDDPADVAADVAADDAADDAVKEEVGDYAACGGLSVAFCGEDRACADCSSDGWECKSGGEGPDNAYYWQCVPDPSFDSQADSLEEEEEGEESAAVVADLPGSVVVDPAEAASTENNATDAEAAIDPAPENNGTAAILVAEYAQCGGRDLCEGEDVACGTCTEGFYCERGNEWYHQCVPGPGSPDSNANATEEDPAAVVLEEEEEPGAGANATSTDGNGNFTIPADSEGLAQTTRFFDGCKASCAWTGNVGPTVSGPVQSCSNEFVNGTQVRNDDPDLKSVCGGGGNDPAPGGSYAYECTDRAPFTDSSQRYAFAAANSKCCECYELTFLDTSIDGSGQPCSGCSAYDGSLAGETVIIQVINSGGDLGEKQFDLQIPGGGFGIFNGVAGQESGNNGPPLFEDSDVAAWEARYGGVTERDQCFQLPASVQEGCLWRFDSLNNADNPGVSYKRVKCGYHPKLYEKSGCLLASDVVQA